MSRVKLVMIARNTLRRVVVFGYGSCTHLVEE